MFPKQGHTLLSDVAYMNEYQHCNTPFLLIFLDGYCRYLSVHVLNSLKSLEVAKVLDTFLTENIHKYVKMLTDCGIKFETTLSNLYITYIKYIGTLHRTNQQRLPL